MRWQNAIVTKIVRRSPTVSSFFFRLTAPDGYRAQRSYSIASAPEETDHVELAIERLDDGEVSPFFHDVVQVGDEIELSEPIGGHFIWRVEDGGPVLLIAGGSGIVPFVSMARHHANVGSAVPMLLLFSARTRLDLLFAKELDALRDRRRGFDMITTLTREAEPPPDVSKGRIDAAMIAATLARLPASPKRVYICGANSFVENAAQHAIDAGVEPALISTERYGV